MTDPQKATTPDKTTGLDFSRTRHLFEPTVLDDAKVTAIGLGSGGWPVCEHLTNAGVRFWDFYDPDFLEEANLVKHPAQRKDLGRPKVDIGRDWVLDRNPNAIVNTYRANIMRSEEFRESVRTSELVLLSADPVPARQYTSDCCVELGVPFVGGLVFRTGVGGDVYAYIPGETGCLRCLDHFRHQHNAYLTDDQLGLTGEEEERIYGLNEKDFRASGLSIDIQMISLIQARMALSTLLRGKDTKLPPMKANFVIFGNRPKEGIFTHHFQSTQLLLKPQTECFCQQETGGEDAV